MLNRRGVTFIEIIVTMMILGVIAAIVVQNEAAATKIGSDVARIDQTARVLGELADAVGRTTGTGGATSFNQIIGQANATTSANAGKLSQLTTPITSSGSNSCMYTYTQSEAGRWVKPFYHRLMPTTGVQLAPGFFAQDSMIRFNSAGAATTLANRPGANDAFSYGTLAIVMPDVSASDAQALLNRVEGDPTGATGAVRYTPAGAANVTVYYHFTIRGC